MSDDAGRRVPVPPSPPIIRIILSGGAAASLVAYDLLLHWRSPGPDLATHDTALVALGVSLILGTALASHAVFTRVDRRYESAEGERRRLAVQNERLAAGRLPAQRRAAYTLHEVVAQDLSACRALLSAAASCTDEEERAGLLSHLDELIGGSISSARRVAAELSPGIFEELGLAVALDVLTDTIQRSRGIHVRSDVNPCWRLLSIAAQSDLRDTLTDLVARASEIKEVTFIDLKVAPDSGRLVAQVAYDGRDLEDPPCQRGYLADGAWTCAYTPMGDSGTAIELTMPLEMLTVASSTSR